MFHVVKYVHGTLKFCNVYNNMLVFKWLLKKDYIVNY